MIEVLKINGHDYSKFVEQKGYGWSRNDLDGGQSGRTKDGVMRRVKVAAKRKISYTLFNMTRADLARRDDDLSTAEFNATYLDIHGVTTRRFYCSTFSATCDVIDGDDDKWEGATFDMTEI